LNGTSGPSLLLRLAARQLRPTVIGILVATALCIPRPVAAQGELERARRDYNAGNFDGAIASAEGARRKAVNAPASALIIARSRLERFRRLANPEDLNAARAELVAIDLRGLSRQEILEWQIGLGEALFLDNLPGPASEMFNAVIPSARARLTPAEIEKLIEWWATSISRVAESANGAARIDEYRELRTVCEGELERDPASRAATYWIVAALRGTGELDRAWNAAIAGWIRAGAMVRADELRADLDRLVVQTIIPERAQARTGQRLDAANTAAAIATMTAEWRGVTGRWTGPAAGASSEDRSPMPLPSRPNSAPATNYSP
jgi:hypothetical protein